MLPQVRPRNPCSPQGIQDHLLKLQNNIMESRLSSEDLWPNSEDLSLTTGDPSSASGDSRPTSGVHRATVKDQKLVLGSLLISRHLKEHIRDLRSSVGQTQVRRFQKQFIIFRSTSEEHKPTSGESNTAPVTSSLHHGTLDTLLALGFYLTSEDIPIEEPSALCWVSQLCSTLCDPMNCSPSSFSVLGISQERIPGWVTTSCSKGIFNPRIKPVSHVYFIASKFFTCEAIGGAPVALNWL